MMLKRFSKAIASAVGASVGAWLASVVPDVDQAQAAAAIDYLLTIGLTVLATVAAPKNA